MAERKSHDARSWAKKCGYCRNKFSKPSRFARFCDKCFEKVIKMDGEISFKKSHAVEKSYLVEMVSKRYRIRPISAKEKRDLVKKGERPKKRPSVDARLGELERIFGLKRKNSMESVSNLVNEKHFAAVEIQRVFRGFVVRIWLLQLHAVFSSFQAHCRGCLVRRQEILLMKRAERDAAIRLQCLVRQRDAKVRFFERKREHKLALEALQRKQEQEEAACAVSIQKNIRKMREKQRFNQVRHSATKIQSLVRMWLGKCYYYQLKRLHAAATLVQKHIRGLLGKRRARWARERKAALYIQTIYRGRRGRVRALAFRAKWVTLQTIWDALKASPTVDVTEMGTKLVEFIQSRDTFRDTHFSLGEAYVHVGLFFLIHEMDFANAINAFQTCKYEQEDPRAYYGLALSQKMQNMDPNKALRNQILSNISYGKRLDQRHLLRGNRRHRKYPPVLFGPDGLDKDINPLVDELDYLLRKHMDLYDSVETRCKRLCLYGIFMQFVRKEQAAGAIFLQEARTLCPKDLFVLSCFYGKGTDVLNDVEVTLEDFEGYDTGLLKPLLLTKVPVKRKGHEVTFRIFQRLSKSKWGAQSGEYDLLVELTGSQENQTHHLILSHGRMKEWVRYLDRPTLLRKPRLASRMLLEDLDLMTRQGETKVDGVYPWSSLTPVLNFNRGPVGELVQRTKAGYLLALKVFLEPCETLRVTAFCEKVQDTFNIIIDRSTTEQLCLDSPASKRLFQDFGWRDAVTHSDLIRRVTSLLELVRVPNEVDMDRHKFFTRQSFAKHMLVSNRVIQQNIQEKYSSVGKKSNLMLVVENLDLTLRHVLESFSSSKIQGLFRGNRDRAIAKIIRLHRKANKIQACYRGHLARKDYALLYADLVRHRMATRIASLVRCFLVKLTMRDRLQEVFASPATPFTWKTSWPVLSLQRKFCLANNYGRRCWMVAFEHDYECETQREGKEEVDPVVLYLDGIARFMVCDLEGGLKSVRRARSFDIGQTLFRGYETQFFLRAARIQSQNPWACMAYAIVLYFIKSDCVRALQMAKRATQIDKNQEIRGIVQMLITWEKRKIYACVQIQRAWRRACNNSRIVFHMAIEHAWAKKAYEMYKQRGKPPQWKRMKKLVFGKLVFEQQLDESQICLFDECIDLFGKEEGAVFRYGKSLVVELISHGTTPTSDGPRVTKLEAQDLFQQFFSLGPALHKQDFRKESVAQLLIGMFHIVFLNEIAHGVKYTERALQTDPTNTFAAQIYQKYCFQTAFVEQTTCSEKVVTARKQLMKKRMTWKQRREDFLSTQKKLLTFDRLEEALEEPPTPPPETEEDAPCEKPMTAFERQESILLQDVTMTEREKAELRKNRRKTKRKTTKQIKRK